ncbi:ribonuclease domain-containing protein [Guggenheimella bovis]
MRKNLIWLLLVVLILFGAKHFLTNAPLVEENTPPLEVSHQADEAIDENGSYTSKEDVSQYLFTYGKLPKNFITKKEAQKLGWDPQKGNLWEVTDRMSIGGDVFSNREKKLPTEKGRKYFECDIDYNGGPRNAKRIVFSNDGLVFYTDDHYEHFSELKEQK